MDFNNIEERISRLYISINSHFDSYKETEVIREEKIEDGKKNIIVTIGASPINEIQQFEAYNKLISIIHSIYNLKDNLKNYFCDNGFNEKLVEEEVNNSYHLKLIADLSNQEKHGYPLKNRRSKLDPRIENIRDSYIVKMPVSKIFYNGMAGRVLATADIKDLNHNFLITYEELIEKSLEKWEDFLIDNLPKISKEILNNRNLKKERELRINKIQEFVDEVYLILDNCEWINIERDKLTSGMIVRNSINGMKYSNNGLITELYEHEILKMVAKMIHDLPLPFCIYQIDKYNWQIIDKLKIEDSVKLTHFFNNYPNLVQEIQSLI